MKKLIFTVSCFILLGGSSFLKSQTGPSGYKIVNKFHIEGDGGWDYLNVDEVHWQDLCFTQYCCSGY